MEEAHLGDGARINKWVQSCTGLDPQTYLFILTYPYLGVYYNTKPHPWAGTRVLDEVSVW